MKLLFWHLRRGKNERCLFVLKLIVMKSRWALYLLFFLLGSCGPPIGQGFKAMELGLKIEDVAWAGGKIRTYSSGLKVADSAVVIFVHGSPGEASGWKAYLTDIELGENFRIIAYDRPGYGKSGPPWRPLGEQISALNALINKESGPVTLVGHSMGGPIVLGATADQPEKVVRTIVLAGSVDPERGPTRPLNAFLKKTHADALLPKSLRTSNEEVHALRTGLEDLESRLGDIKSPVTVIQGKKDWLVPYQNVAYLREKLTSVKLKEILLQNEGHFLPWKQLPLIKEEILAE